MAKKNELKLVKFGRRHEVCAMKCVRARDLREKKD
jgi:hypothetical protein